MRKLIGTTVFAVLLMAGLAGAEVYDRVRNLVQRTQDDLQRIRDQGARNGKEKERIDNARKSLSDFDRELAKDKFDKDKIDSAIDDVKHLLESNTLDARDRDALTADLADLRSARETRGR